MVSLINLNHNMTLDTLLLVFHSCILRNVTYTFKTVKTFQLSKTYREAMKSTDALYHATGAAEFNMCFTNDSKRV